MRVCSTRQGKCTDVTALSSLVRFGLAFLLVVSGTMLFVAPGVFAATGDAPSATEGNMPADYWPFADGNRWRFIGNGIEMAFVVIELGPGEYRVDAIANDFVIQREYYTVRDGNIYATRREQPGGGFTFTPPQLFLEGPFVPGHSWVWEGELAGEKAKTTSVVLEPETINTPLGVFEAVPVHLTVETETESLTNERWFVHGVGIVRERAQVPGIEETVILDIVLAEYRVR